MQICVCITQNCLFEQISAVLKNKPKYSTANTEKSQTLQNLLSSFSFPHKEMCLTTMKDKKTITPLSLTANHSCLNAYLMYFKNAVTLVSF